MLALFLLIACLYISSIQSANAGIQYVTYRAPLQCYQEYSAGRWLAQVMGSHRDTAMCEFPAHIRRNEVNYDYSVTNIGNEVKNFTASLLIEFNDTITRYSDAEPLKYVIEGDGIVRSQLFNGYHAKQLIKNLYYQVVDEEAFDMDSWYSGPINVCDSNGGYTQTMQVRFYLVVYPNSLSEQSVNEIHTNLTYISESYDSWTPAMKDPQTFFTTTLNSSGMICSGGDFSYFTTS